MKPYYQDKYVTLYHGDCREVLPTLERADLVLTDPPYGITQAKWDVPVSEFFSILAPFQCPLIVFTAAPFDKTLAVANLSDFKYEYIWHKTHPTGHLNAKKRPLRAHETILLFSNSNIPYYPIKTKGHERKTAVRKKVDKSPLYGKQAVGSSYDSTERYPTSILKFKADKQTAPLHPTQKPIALVDWLIRTHTKSGEMVLDPFAGSGTTMAAARRSGRRSIGIEREEKYCEVAAKRMSQEVLEF